MKKILVFCALALCQITYSMQQTSKQLARLAPQVRQALRPAAAGWQNTAMRRAAIASQAVATTPEPSSYQSGGSAGPSAFDKAAYAAALTGLGVLGYQSLSEQNRQAKQKSDYTVNLMWINKTFKEGQNYLFPSKNESDLRKDYLDTLFKWAAMNPKSTINLWFDSLFVTDQAIQNTQALIKEHMLKNSKTARIELKDVRELSYVKNNTEVFSEKTPVYFRADLLRIITALNTLTTTGAPYFVYADLDVTPLSQAELFDASTVQNLERYGIVMAKDKAHGFENSFEIISKNKPNLIKAIELMLIDLNIARAYNALNGEFYNVSNRRNVSEPMKPLQQIVYDSYRPMFRYFYHLEGLGKLTIDNRLYDYRNDGLQPFGLHRLKVNGPLRFTVDDNDLKEKTKYDDTRWGLWIPTKEVAVPHASLNYD